MQHGMPPPDYPTSDRHPPARGHVRGRTAAAGHLNKQKAASRGVNAATSCPASTIPAHRRAAPQTTPHEENDVIAFLPAAKYNCMALCSASWYREPRLQTHAAMNHSHRRIANTSVLSLHHPASLQPCGLCANRMHECSLACALRPGREEPLHRAPANTTTFGNTPPYTT